MLYEIVISFTRLCLIVPAEEGLFMFIFTVLIATFITFLSFRVEVVEAITKLSLGMIFFSNFFRYLLPLPPLNFNNFNKKVYISIINK
jgi:hypothetical protein